jgi:tripartite motif-containing protein 71
MNRKLLFVILILVTLFVSSSQSVVVAGAPASARAGADKPPVRYAGKIDTTAQHMGYCCGIAVDVFGNVYATDWSITPRVLKYDKRGNFVREWGSPGSGPGQFKFVPGPNDPQGPNSAFIAVDRQGNVFVSDGYNSRVQKFDPDGRFLMQFGSQGYGDGQFEPPCSGPIYIDKHNNIYVSTFSRVQKFDARGNFLASYGSAGSGEGQFLGASMGAIDHQGNMYVADLFNARVQKLDSNGRFVQAWGSPGSGPGQFYMPVGIVLDNLGRLYVVDNLDRVQAFNTDGTFLDQWSYTGDGNPPLSLIVFAVAIDNRGDLYVNGGDTGIIYIYHTTPK